MKEEEITPEEKHSIWMKNAGFFYDRLLVQKLKWPSLTFQWLPFIEQDSFHIKYQFIYASHSSGGAPIEHLYIAEVAFPKLKNMGDDPGQPESAKVKNLFKFNHQSEINKARASQTNPDFIATRIDEGPVAIFQKGVEYPSALLEGNLNGGFGLDWRKYGLVTGDFQGNMLVWKDIQQKPMSFKYPINIQDTKWVNEDIIAAVSDDGCLSFWDLRSGSIVQQVKTAEEKKQVYSVSPNPHHLHLILTGGEDEAVKIWDTRNLSAKLHRFQGHDGNIMTVDWSPVNSSVFASGSTDQKVKIWDLMRVGFQIPKDLGGTDELLFTHEGHQGSINDLGWNHHEMIIGSTEQDKNSIQFYQIVHINPTQTNNIHELEYAQDIEYLRRQCFS